jgi:hypothetical protein
VSLLFLVLLSCSFENNNPLETDDLLKNAPTISNILFEQNNGFVLYLAKSYPQNYTLHFERKADVAFIPVTLKGINEATYADTSFSIEHDYNFMYRVRVEKDGYFSDFSNEKAFQYISNTLFAPANFMAISVELQGVRLNWQDNSGNETGYKIEKNENGEGFQELATLPANSQTYFDEISGMPAIPLNLIYRVRAFSNSMTSDWQSQTIAYSGLGAPTNLLITNNSYYNFTISWTRNSIIATGYDVERKQDENPFALLATVASSVNTYSDFLDEIGTYFYRVRAVKDDIYSSYTNEISYHNLYEFLLDEDFEDNELDQRISISVIGNYNNYPGIKNISSFGSSKAFGFGLSTCSANCYNNYMVKLIIAFSNTIFVSKITFKEMELYGNWGSNGWVCIDGVYVDDSGFGREPGNDHNADTDFRYHEILINQNLSLLEFIVTDITNSSEIFIDDVKIFK